MILGTADKNYRQISQIGDVYKNKREDLGNTFYSNHGRRRVAVGRVVDVVV